MEKSSLYRRIRNFLISDNHKIDSVHGFQLKKTDVSKYLSDFLSKEQLDTMLRNINSSGYLDSSIGGTLKSIIENNDSDLYIKSIHDSHLDSIFIEGIRCYGNTASIGTVNPTSIDEVNLGNTVEKIDEFPVLISRIKGNYGFSHGGIQINGTLILQIPKNISNDELLYFNEQTQTYNIKPDYIVGFLPVDEEHKVKDWCFPNRQSNKKHTI